MLSRVADASYWMFRYLERAMNLIRFINSDMYNLLYNPDNTENIWRSLIAVTGDAELFEKTYGQYSEEHVIRFLSFDEENDNSILSSMIRARENARSIREIISSEIWEEVNALYHRMREYARRDSPVADAPAFCKDMRLGGHTIIGMYYATMNRSEAWHFARIGMLLERADKISRILDVKYFILLPSMNYIGSVYEDTQWGALLSSASALEMYRKRYKKIQPENIIRFLIFDRAFPRSINYCVHFSLQSVLELEGYNPRVDCRELKSRLHFLLDTALEKAVPDILHDGLHEYLDWVQGLLNGIDVALSQSFFFHLDCDKVAALQSQSQVHMGSEA